jgi:hypothetical protein
MSARKKFSQSRPWRLRADSWKQVLNERLPLYGHRNWIVIADSAYPDQARAGIETVVAGADQLSVLEYVLGVLSSAKHVRPIVFTDRELKYVPDADAPGVEAYRTASTIFSMEVAGRLCRTSRSSRSSIQPLRLLGY